MTRIAKGLKYISYGAVAMTPSSLLSFLFVFEIFGILVENLARSARQQTFIPGSNPYLSVSAEFADYFVIITSILSLVGYTLIVLGVRTIRESIKAGSLTDLLPIGVLWILAGYLIARWITSIEVGGTQYTGVFIGLQLIVVGLILLVLGYADFSAVLSKLAHLYDDTKYIIASLLIPLSLIGIGILRAIGWILVTGVPESASKTVAPSGRENSTV